MSGFRGGDGETHVAHTVLHNMNRQRYHSSLQPLAANLADDAEILGTKRADHVVVVAERLLDNLFQLRGVPGTL